MRLLREHLMQDDEDQADMDDFEGLEMDEYPAFRSKKNRGSDSEFDDSYLGHDIDGYQDEYDDLGEEEEPEEDAEEPEEEAEVPKEKRKRMGVAVISKRMSKPKNM